MVLAGPPYPVGAVAVAVAVRTRRMQMRWRYGLRRRLCVCSNFRFCQTWLAATLIIRCRLFRRVFVSGVQLTLPRDGMEVDGLCVSPCGI